MATGEQNRDEVHQVRSAETATHHNNLAILPSGQCSDLFVLIVCELQFDQAITTKTAVQFTVMQEPHNMGLLRTGTRSNKTTVGDQHAIKAGITCFNRAIISEVAWMAAAVELVKKLV